ncbi:uncharacterized protein LOC125263332 [Megalobrama amblycephala]|uniref:uncharacterized protein LOC125263332 n=1 Tax=Megalobrama amblycephala TaxID=75352 RepID=UPI002013EAB6|nr:uncharacterized protein LOC125263332 [Megalobrama amblycephala]
MEKMFLKLVLLCLCLWRLDGAFGFIDGKQISVREGETVTLNLGPGNLRVDVIVWWKFAKTLIAEIHKQAKKLTVYDDILDGRFKDKLKLNKHSGSLTISNVRPEHSGRYGINGTNKHFVLTVYAKPVLVNEGDSVTLNSGRNELKANNRIEWRFGDSNTLIAKMNKQDDSITIYDDVLGGRFKDSLKVDKQTGSLTITNTRRKHDGEYRIRIHGANFASKKIRVSVYDRLPVPVISSNCSQCSSSSSSCSVVCSVVDVSHMTLSWYKGNSLLSSISVSDLSISLSLPLEVENQDKNTYSCVLNDPTSNQTQHLDINEIRQKCSGVSDDGKKESALVKDGASVTLPSNLTEIKDDDVILWKFGYENTLIAEINKQDDRFTVYDDVLDGRFKDKLKLDHQTGSLTITDFTIEHTGYYKRKINGVIKRFRLSVQDEKSAKEGDSVTLDSGFTELVEDEFIQWVFIPENKDAIVVADSFTVYKDAAGGRFRDSLKVDQKTGSLTITNIRPEHAGGYGLITTSVFKSFNLIVSDPAKV